MKIKDLRAKAKIRGEGFFTIKIVRPDNSTIEVAGTATAGRLDDLRWFAGVLEGGEGMPSVEEVVRALRGDRA